MLKTMFVNRTLKMKLEQMTTDTKEKQQEIDRVDMKLEVSLKGLGIRLWTYCICIH
jgi:hypothetical protein